MNRSSFITGSSDHSCLVILSYSDDLKFAQSTIHRWFVSIVSFLKHGETQRAHTVRYGECRLRTAVDPRGGSAGLALRWWRRRTEEFGEGTESLRNWIPSSNRCVEKSGAHDFLGKTLEDFSHIAEAAMPFRNWRGVGDQGIWDRLRLRMIVRRLLSKSGFGGVNGGNWHYVLLRVSPLIVGALALSTTLLFGSFLWGYISRKSKHSRETPPPIKDFFPPVSHKPNTVITIHDFTISAPPSKSVVNNDFDNGSYFDTLVFDPENDYAQVLAEARLHAATQLSISANAVTQGTKEPRTSRSHSARRHNPFMEDLETIYPQHRDRRLPDPFKSSKSWKKLLFWKRFKKSNAMDFDLGHNFVRSNCSTPLHHLFKAKTRATVTPTSSTVSSHRKPSTRRANSGPVYSDGIPYVPATRAGRPVSGPLSGSTTPCREGLYESPYVPLKKPGGGGGAGNRTPSGPLYVVT